MTACWHKSQIQRLTLLLPHQCSIFRNFGVDQATLMHNFYLHFGVGQLRQLSSRSRAWPVGELDPSPGKLDSVFHPDLYRGSFRFLGRLIVLAAFTLVSFLIFGNIGEGRGFNTHSSSGVDSAFTRWRPVTNWVVVVLVVQDRHP